jgi:hypothetical protein
VQFIYIHLKTNSDFIYLSNTRDDFEYDTPEVGPLYSSILNLFFARFTSDESVGDHGFRAKYKQSCGAAPDLHNYRLLTASNSWKTLSVGYERLSHFFWRVHTLNAGCQALAVLTKVANPKVEFCFDGSCSDLNTDYEVAGVSNIVRAKRIIKICSFVTGPVVRIPLSPEAMLYNTNNIFPVLQHS